MTDAYVWEESELHHAHAYLRGPLRAELERWRGCKRIVDAGCGNGLLTTVAKDLFPEVFAFDSSASGVELAKKRLGCEVACGSVYDDWLELFSTDEPFDGAVSTEVVEHLYDPRKFVKRAHDAIRPGGHLLVTTPYHGYLKNLALAVTGKLDSHFGPLWDGGHIKFWSRKTLTQLLEEGGFRVVGFRGAGRVAYLWKSMILTAVRC